MLYGSCVGWQVHWLTGDMLLTISQSSISSYIQKVNQLQIENSWREHYICTEYIYIYIYSGHFSLNCLMWQLCTCYIVLGMMTGPVML